MAAAVAEHGRGIFPCKANDSMSSDRLPRDPLKREALKNAEKPEASDRMFIHLRVHSAYSLLEGALKLDKVVGHAVKDAAPAIAVADTNNLFGALEFAQKATKDGVQPLIGCQVDVDFADGGDTTQRSHGWKQALDLYPVVLIAATEAGYANLVRLVSRLYLETPPGDPVHATLDWLAATADGIICLTGHKGIATCLEGKVDGKGTRLGWRDKHAPLDHRDARHGRTTLQLRPRHCRGAPSQPPKSSMHTPAHLLLRLEHRCPATPS